MDKRLVDLEIRYTHLERQLDELNQVVFQQQMLLDRVNQVVNQLRARLIGLDEEGPPEKPPHY